MLVFVKALHTLAWAILAGCVLTVPLAASLDHYAWAAWSFGVVAVEVIVLAINQWTCPLTPIAARYTDDRRANFDIYLPEWLARHNKSIFGSLYIAGIAFALLRFFFFRSS